MENSNKETNRKICKKCLLRDMDQEAYFEKLSVYIESIEEERKADKQIYEARLELCTTCDLLLEGMCRACGCFVELRAVIKKNRCPYEKW